MELLFCFTGQDGRLIGCTTFAKTDGFTCTWQDANISLDHESLRGNPSSVFNEHRSFERRFIFFLKELDETVQPLNVECIVSRGLTVDFFVRSEDVLKSPEESD